MKYFEKTTRDNNVVRVCIAGINGRMGRELVQALDKFHSILLTSGLVSVNSKLCGLDVSELIGIQNLKVKVHENLVDIKDDFDILIDFTRPEATLQHVDFCCCHNKNMVIGTTGFTDLQKEIIYKAAGQIGIVFSANFSIGVNVMFFILKKIAQVIGKYVDIDIIDIHHRGKLDAPSGTALAMKKCIIDALGDDSLKYLIYNCMKQSDIRQSNSIGMTSIRTGDVVGEHIVLFSGEGERLEIIHKSSSRMIYAIGALRAALWLYNENNIGLFDMLDILNFDVL